MANEEFTVVGTNIAENAAMIWNAADMLRGPFKPHEYIIAGKNVICLNIPDDYSYMDDDLYELLESVVPEYL